MACPIIAGLALPPGPPSIVDRQHCMARDVDSDRRRAKSPSGSSRGLKAPRWLGCIGAGHACRACAWSVVGGGRWSASPPPTADRTDWVANACWPVVVEGSICRSARARGSGGGSLDQGQEMFLHQWGRIGPRVVASGVRIGRLVSSSCHSWPFHYIRTVCHIWSLALAWRLCDHATKGSSLQR